MSYSKLDKALAKLVLDQPVFAAMVLEQNIVEDSSGATPTASTDGSTIRYNPTFIDTLDVEELMFLLAHEGLHPCLLHHVRKHNRDHRKWNQAADYELNPLLLDAGMKMPERGLYNKEWGDLGLNAERIFTLLPEEDASGGSGDGDGDNWNMGEVLDSGDPDKTKAENTAKERLGRAIQVGRMMGKLPARMERYADTLIRPEESPLETLRRFFTEAQSKDDYSWKRPNRRFVAEGTYLPSLYSESMGEMVIAVDTSGSIGDMQLALFSGYINAVLQEVKPLKVHVVYADAEVNSTEEFLPGDYPIVLKAVGGGGTAFAPVFEWVELQSIQPACLVYLTDLCGSFPNQAPSYPVLWMSICEGTAPFGEIKLLT